ncbi:MAG: GTPase HflX [Candidatus Tokpelaia hoelldobleri]|uniref:GTPase HflX n=1 Tax=Candidatus Tokpelaia hoelldobleri TaxID=1902579 RepID=A0A1U9JUT3_9HYPH|nr:MAG: GTPase HflX [Candidatus Tokpelaia hoelldoblerii]
MVSDHKTPDKSDFITQQPDRTRALVVVPLLKHGAHSKEGEGQRSAVVMLEEAIGLARAIDLDIVFSECVTVAQPKPATLLGAGKVDELADIIAGHEIDLAIIDHALTPVQQRNLEKAWHCKVIDRTALILEIFGERARTKEGVLQVELAHLNYQKGRLVRSWTHLERQRGGGGFLGGPGETQIEADRRILQEKINRIKRELATVVKTRKLHRAKRKKTPHPVVALVGYTNAGKSTLFNTMTGADVLAEDMLFATLDPTLRQIKLPLGETVILSDTVGFISNLPTHLVAAFRATLEEVVEADLIIHVRDMSDPDHIAHRQDVLNILASLAVDIDNPDKMIEVWNKLDLVPEEAAQQLQLSAKSAALPTFPVSALKGTGVPALIQCIEEKLNGGIKHMRIRLKPQELSLLDWLYRHGDNHRQIDHEDGSVSFEVDLTQAAYTLFQARRQKLKN